MMETITYLANSKIKHFKNKCTELVLARKYDVELSNFVLSKTILSR